MNMGAQIWMSLYYNIMFATKLLLVGINLAIIILQIASFEIKIGDAAILLKDYYINSTEDVEESGLFVRRGLIFPYDVYEIPTHGSTNVEAKSYYLVKMQYQLLAQSFQLQNKSLPHVDQYQILYKRIPQIVAFEGKQNQYLEFIRHDPSIYNHRFIVKNSTAQKRSEGVYNLNFYSLRITKYLEKIIRLSQREMRSPLKQQEVKQILETDTHFNEKILKESQNERNELILRYFLDNDKYYETIYPSEVLNVEMTRQITVDTLWSVKYDGFSIFYSSAVIKKNEVVNKQVNNQNENLIDLFIIVSRQSEEKRFQHIKQPMKYLNLSVIKHLQICSSMQKLKLLLADNQNLYVIDITTHLWNLDSYKIDVSFQNIFFDKQCKLFKINSKSVSEVEGIRKIQFQSVIRSVSSLENFIVFCLQDNTCKVHPKNLAKEIKEIKLSEKNYNIEWEELVRINGTWIEYQLGYRQKWSYYQLFQQISRDQVVQAINLNNYSYFYEFIYPYEQYLNKSSLRQKQTDKTFFDHLQRLQNKQIYRLPSNYFQFSQKLSQIKNNCTTSTSNQSDDIISINSEGDWAICTMSISTNSLILFKITTQKVESRMYICQSLLQNHSGNIGSDCSLLIAPANSEKSYYITNNRHIKFYVLRAAKQKHFPTFYFRDIDKQQLAFASTVFFFLMLILAISFFLIILLIILRPIVIAIMIYFNWRQDLTVPTYPLGWFQLKIKIKRLVQMHFLRYVPHQPRNQDEDNHCCFCLQNLTKEMIIAQLYCQHEFHKQCFNEWIKNQPNLRCPTCRREFTRQNLNEFRSTHNLMIG